MRSHPTVRLRNLCVKDTEVTHRELCWLVRQTVKLENRQRSPSSMKHSTHQRIRHVEIALERSGQSFSRLPETTLNNIVAKPPVDLREHLPLMTAVCEHVLEHMLTQYHEEILSDARRAAYRQSNPVESHLPLWGRVLDLDSSPPQQWSSAAAGDYFILRRVFATPRLLVSHMKITPGPEPNLPAEFVTRRGGFLPSGEQGDREVHGIIYAAGSAEGVLFTIGKIANSSEIRSTILKLVRKPVRNPNDYPMDLKGIRLGLSQPDRLPLGYRIWCARLPGKEPEGGWMQYATDYSVTGRHEFSQYVEGYGAILAWLNKPSGGFL